MQRNNPSKSKRLLYSLIAGVFFMFAFSYMLVPIFNFVCKQTGINGKNVISASTVKPGMQIDTSRTIKIEFASVVHGGLDFKFYPLQKSIEIHPGERKTIYFYAGNNTHSERTVQAVPSITPIDGARFFKKIECFCFTQQFFRKNERADMPVNFYIDPALPKEVKEITLSYTLFDASGFERKGQAHVISKSRIEL